MARRWHVAAWGNPTLGNLDYETDRLPGLLGRQIMENYPFVSIHRRGSEEKITTAAWQEISDGPSVCIEGERV